VSSRSRGQVATEFLLYTAVFMFITIAAFVVVNQLLSSEIPLQQNTVAKETGDQLADAVTLSVKGGLGFSYNYTFPRTIFGNPYRVYLTNLSDGFMLMEWTGEYGDFTYSYPVPSGFGYKVEGSCLSGAVLESEMCSNMLMFVNDGENLTVRQLA
jgi:hypothetical protein